MKGRGRLARAVVRAWNDLANFRGSAIFIFQLSVALIAIIAGVHFEAIAENRRCPLFLPFDHLDQRLEHPVSLEQLRADAQTVASFHERTYLFALDCSDSANDPLEVTPSWFERSVRQLQKREYTFSEKSSDERTRYDAAKIALYVALDSLITVADAHDEASPSDHFAVWDVCGKAAKKAPETGLKLPVGREEVEEAIKAVEDWEYGSEEDRQRTDFLELMEKLKKNYQITDEEVGERSFVISMVSDFLDDPDGKGPKAQAVRDRDPERVYFFQRREQQIRRLTRQLPSDRITFNFISVVPLTNDSMDLVSFIRRDLKWYRYNRFNLLDDFLAETGRLFYPVTVATEGFRLWYHNPHLVDGDVVIDAAGQELVVGIPIAGEIDNAGFELTYGERFSNKELKVKGRIYPGETAVLESSMPNTELFLRFTGPLPREPKVIRIFDQEARQTYLIPIDFLRRLPSAASRHMLVLLGLGALPVLLFSGAVLINWVMHPNG